MMRLGNIAGVLLACVIPPALAANDSNTPEKDVIYPAAAEHVDYAALNGLPDWRGIWTPNFSPMGAGKEEPALKGSYLSFYKDVRAGKASSQSKTSNCTVPGMPGVMMMPYDIEFLFTPGRVTLIQEAYMQVRRIYTDGRHLPDDPDPTYNGHSIGHWNGSTLVVETTGIKSDIPLGAGIKHSDVLRITEQIHLAPNDANTLIDELTFTDAKALKKPWHQTLSYTRHREWDQLEYVCNENDRNPIEPDGKTDVILPSN